MPHCVRVPIVRPLPGTYVRVLAVLVIVGALAASGGAIAPAWFDAGAAVLAAHASPQFWQAWFRPVGVLLTIGVAQAVVVVALLRERGWQRHAKHEAQRRGTEFTHAARLSTMGVFAASIAHEINQPLGAILINADAAEIILDQE